MVNFSPTAVVQLTAPLLGAVHDTTRSQTLSQKAQYTWPPSDAQE